MRTLILGAKGTLGQYLAESFKSSNPICWDSADFNLSDIERIFEKIEQVNPEVIINAAAYNNVDSCETDDGETEAFKINGEAVGWLGQAASQVGAILVHFSTDYVFDGSKPDGYVENDEPRPCSKYGQSKMLGEKLLASNCGRFYLIRTSRLFGKRGGSVNSKKNFVDLMIELAGTKRRLEVVDNEISKPTYAADLAEAVHRLILKAHPFGVYHLVNEGAVSWYDFAVKIFETKLKAEKCRLAPGKGIDAVKIKPESDSSCGLFSLPSVVPIAASKFPHLAKRPHYSILLNTKFPPLRRYEEALEEYFSKT